MRTGCAAGPNGGVYTVKPLLKCARRGRAYQYIGTSEVSRYRVFSYIDGDVLPDHTIIVFAYYDDFTFGVLHSRFHELWACAMGTQLREAELGLR